VRKVRNLFVNTEQFEATVVLRQLELQRAETDSKRRSGLDEPGAVSAEDIQHARAAVSTAKAALTVAREQLNSTRSLVEDTTIAQHPDVRAAAGHVREAYLALQRVKIPSAVTGYVAKRSVQVGQRVSGDGADGYHCAQRSLGGCQLQGSAAAPLAYRSARHPYRGFLRRQD
jgi:membrane fusion protein (multidrug efflux system)